MPIEKAPQMIGFASNSVGSVGEAMVEMAPVGAGMFWQGFAGDTFYTIWHCLDGFRIDEVLDDNLELVTVPLMAQCLFARSVKPGDVLA